MNPQQQYSSNSNMNENEYNNLLNRMNYLTINDPNFNNNINKQQIQPQMQTQQSQQPQPQPQYQQNMYDSLNDMIMCDYCEPETSLFQNGYFSSSIYH